MNSTSAPEHGNVVVSRHRVTRMGLLVLLPRIAATVVWVHAATAAEIFPNKPLRWISPYAAGGGADLTTRTVAQKLGSLVGQTVVVDNRTGASGKIAVELATRSPADGYTLVTITPTISTNQDISGLAPLTQMTSQNYVWVVQPSFPATTLRELLAVARAKPGSLHYGSAGVGTMQHIAGALLGSMTGTELVHVPYKGGALALTDLLSGQLQFFAGDMWSCMQHIKSGKLRGLAVTAAKRSPVLPDLPTTAEAGVAGYEVQNWYGVAAHARTPGAILNRLNLELTRALRSPDVHDRITQEGSSVVASSAEDFAANIRRSVQQLRVVAKDSGLRAE